MTGDVFRVTSGTFRILTVAVFRVTSYVFIGTSLVFTKGDFSGDGGDTVIEGGLNLMPALFLRYLFFLLFFCKTLVVGWRDSLKRNACFSRATSFDWRTLVIFLDMLGAVSKSFLQSLPSSPVAWLVLVTGSRKSLSSSGSSADTTEMSRTGASWSSASSASSRSQSS